MGKYKFDEVRDRFKSNTGSFVGRNFSQHEVVRFDIMALGALKKLFHSSEKNRGKFSFNSHQVRIKGHLHYVLKGQIRIREEASRDHSNLDLTGLL